ncbi:MAG: M16 family metallopeptidase [Bdellovibrionales bacterium]
MHFFVGIVLAFSLSLPLLASELDISFDVEKYKLENGLTVLLYKDSSAPIVSHNIWYRVGSKDEEVGFTGLAHLFEHMMFRGTKKYPKKKFMELTESSGIQKNAFTSSDYTGYYLIAPSSKLEIAIDIEADRMKNLIVDQAALNAEIEIVKEERRQRVDNNPRGLMYERLMATLYKVHPYRWPVIGYMKDVERVTPEKCIEFYDTFYSPNNAVLAIGGDIDIEKTKSYIQKYFGSIKPSVLPERSNIVEPNQSRRRISKIKKEVQAPMLSLNYRSAKVGEEDGFALHLLSSILGEGASSRLYDKIVYRDQDATGLYAYNSGSQQDGFFQIFVAMKPNGKARRMENKIAREIERIQKKSVTQRELQKAINQVSSTYVRGLTSIHGKTEALMLNEILLGDYSYLFKDLKKYSTVTTADIQRVAKKYLNKNSRVVIEVVPVKGK